MCDSSKNSAASLTHSLWQGAAVGLAAALSSQLQAAAAPDTAEISLKALSYQDYQPGIDRIKVDAKAISFVTPVAGQWSLSGTFVNDAISGASPKYHTSGITPMVDNRKGYTAGVTRYFSQDSVTAGYSYSTEHDYISRNYSLQNALSTQDQNTTLTVGTSYSDDEILPNSIFLDSRKNKKTLELVAGLTQVITQNDLAQITLRHSRGRGYFADQYKLYDSRPDSRDSNSVVARWNHYFPDSSNALHASYRFYQDSYGIKAHTLELEYVYNLPHKWQLSPVLRYYNQTAANFYYGPVANDPYADADTVGAPISVVYNNYIAGLPASMDQRLSAFGAFTWGMKVEKQFSEHWSADLKFEQYAQKQGFALGTGSPGLAGFYARSIQLGMDYRF